jgi:hypothetical protein
MARIIIANRSDIGDALAAGMVREVKRLRQVNT